MSQPKERSCFYGVLRAAKARREAWLPALPFVATVRQYHLSLLRRWLSIARRRQVAYLGRWSHQGHAAPAALIGRMADAGESDKAMSAATRWLARHPHGRVEELSRGLGFSSCQIQRRFTIGVGYGPKLFQSVSALPAPSESCRPRTSSVEPRPACCEPGVCRSGPYDSRGPAILGQPAKCRASISPMHITFI